MEIFARARQRRLEHFQQRRLPPDAQTLREAGQGNRLPSEDGKAKPGSQQESHVLRETTPNYRPSSVTTANSCGTFWKNSYTSETVWVGGTAARCATRSAKSRIIDSLRLIVMLAIQLIMNGW